MTPRGRDPRPWIRAAVVRQPMLLGASLVIGAVAGAASGGFLWVLDHVTEVRVEHGWLLWALPAAGVVVAFVYHRVGGAATGGIRLTMTEIDDLRDGVPLRMAPLVLVGTLATHLFGGSAGREGTALQMSSALTDGVARRLGVRRFDRRLLLVIALAAGFGSVFGVPVAGIVFAMEVAPCRRFDRATALPGSIVASFVGDRVVAWMGITHFHVAQLGHGGIADLARAVIAGVAFGLCARLFVWGTERWRSILDRVLPHPALHPLVGGAIVVTATLALATRDYSGLSLPLLTRSFSPVEVLWYAFALKLALTAVTVGSGFQGGEVTPLFVVGATLGSTLGHALGSSPALMAGVGMMAVFGSAANASLACVVMGVELFGWSPVLPLALGCLSARLWSSPRHIYERAPRTLADSNN